MDDSVVFLISFLAFTGMVGLITFLLTRRDDHESSDGYFLAGRRLSAGVIAGSLLLTNLSTEQLVGLNGAAFRDGLCVIAWEVVAGASLVLMALYYLPRYLKRGIATVPQFLEERFDAGTRTITTLIFLVAYAGILLPIVLYTGARGLTSMMDLADFTPLKTEAQQIWFMVWLVGIIGSIYAIFGGLRTVAVSDTINGFGLYTGGILISYFGLRQIGNGSVSDGWTTLTTSHPEKFNSLGASDQSVPFLTLFTGVLLLNLFYWSTNQQIIQRTFGAKNLAEGQKGVLLAGFLKVLGPLILVLPGIIAFHVFGVLRQGDEVISIAQVIDSEAKVALEKKAQTPPEDPQDPDQVKAHAQTQQLAQEVSQAWQQAGLPADISPETQITPRVVLVDRGDKVLKPLILDDSVAMNVTESDKLVGYNDLDQAYGQLVRTVMPKPLMGFFAAVMVGAILSSFNSALNSTATLFSLGVYRSMINPQATQKQIIASGKWCGLVVALLAMTSAPFLRGQESIFGYLQKMNGLYFIPIFSVVLVGMATRNVPALAAKVALIVGFATIALGYFVPALDAAVVQRLHEFHFLGVVFVGLVLLMLLIGTVRPRETPYIAEESGDVDLTPWPYAWLVGLAILAFVITVYVYFADPSVLGWTSR